MAHKQGFYKSLLPIFEPFDPTASSVKRIKVVIDHNRIDETLINFPLTLHLGTSSGITNVDTSEIFQDLSGYPGNKKIAVGQLDGSQYPVEISYWNTWERKAVLNVRLPAISNTEDTVFYIFWDKTQSLNTDYISITGEELFDYSSSDGFVQQTGQIFRRPDSNADYGWHLLNGNAVDKIDVNITNVGKLTFDLDDTNTDWYNSTATGPFVYKWLTNDFDVEVKVDHNADANTEAVALQLRDPDASAGEDWVQILTGYDTTKGNNHWSAINTTNNSSSESNGTGNYTFLRIRREGDSITVYNKQYTSDDWTQRGSYTRSDIGDLVQVGIATYTGNTSDNFEVSVDYFKVQHRDVYSDAFDSETEFTFSSQYDGLHDYGWWSLNVANADSIDINITNEDYVTIDTNGTASNWSDATATGPFIYKKIKGDFDVETLIDHNADQDTESARILIRDPEASAGEDWLSIDAHYESASEGVATVNTTNDSSSRSDFASTDKYLRVRRDGETFRLYSKASAGASWTLRSTYTRKDFQHELQVGFAACPVNTNDNYVAQFDYFNIYTYESFSSDDFSDKLSELSDEFGSSTEQDLLTSSGDGEKSYGWHILNSANADVLDVNITNSGTLTYDSDATNTDWSSSTATAPYVYRYLNGDFDVETYISTTNQNQNTEGVRILVRDPNASSGEDWISLGYEYVSGNKIRSLETDSGSTDTRVSVSSSDRYLRIVRQGNTFTFYSSSNGSTWTERDVISRQFNGIVQVGLVFKTGNTSNNFTAEVDYFRITQDIKETTQIIQYDDGDFLFDWKAINVKNAESIDVHRTIQNRLTVTASDIDTDTYHAVFNAPYIYKEITGDFDVETHFEHDADANYEYSELIVRDPTASAGEDWVGLESGYASGAQHFTLNTVNDSSSYSSFSGDWSYLRIKRISSVFQLFAKENAHDEWTLRATYYRYDFADTVQVGLVSKTNNTSGSFVTQFHYFNIKVNEETPGEQVWSNGYERVYHMHEIPEVGVEGIFDSTVHRAHGTSQGTLDSSNVEKNIVGGQGIEFDYADGDHISFPTLKPDDFSIEVITRLDSRTGQWQPFVGFCDTGTQSRRGLFLDSTNEYVSVLYTNNTNGYWREGTNPNGLVIGEINYLALTYDQSLNSPNFYINNVQGSLGTEQSATNGDANVGYIGRDNNTGTDYYLDGMISEVRISSVERSQAWVKASNYSLKDILVYYGDPEFDPEASGDAWERVLNIDVDVSNIDEDLIDFPILLKLGTSSGQTNANLTQFFGYLLSDTNRYKIQLTSDNLYHRIPVEIDHWDHTGKDVVLFAKIPFISSLADSTAGTRLRLYYDVFQTDNTEYVAEVDTFSTYSTTLFSDEFTETTVQGLVDANGDGEKHYGWHILNSSILNNAEVKYLRDTLRIESSTSATDWDDSTATGAFVYKEFLGDFDVEVDFSTTRGNDNDGHGLMVRDPDASAGEDWLYIAEFGSGAWRTRNTTNDVSVESSGSDVLFTDLRIKREGKNFYLYNRPDDSTDDWTLRATYNRTDFADIIQIGIFTVTNSTSAAHVVDANYFRVKHKPAQRVWEDFKAVFHMSQNPSSSDILDSSPGRRHGTVNGTITSDDWVDAQVYKGIDFDYVTTEYIDFGSEVLIESDKPFSITGYSNVRNCETTKYQTPIAIKTDQTHGFIVAFSDNTSYNGLTAGSGSTFETFNTQNLTGSTDFEDQYVVWTVTFDGVDATDLEGYGISVDDVNETLETSGGYISSSNVNQIGRDSAYATRTFDGVIDELWVGKKFQTDAWRKATYYSLTDDFLIYEVEYIPPIEEDVFVGIDSDIHETDIQATQTDSVFVGIDSDIFTYDIGDLGWANRLEIKIPFSKITETLTDFPITLHLDACAGIHKQDVTRIFDHLGADSTEGRFKIAVCDSDGLTQLYVEVEKWDYENKKAVLHVKIPTLTAYQDKYLYLYYDISQPDNTTYVGDTGDTPAKAVWNSNFVAVYHMHGDPSGGAGSVLDSTSNEFHNTAVDSNPFSTNGRIGNAIEFDGSDDALQFNDPNEGWGNECTSADAITVEAFFYKKAGTSTRNIVSSQVANTQAGFFLGFSNTALIELRGRSVSGESVEIATGDCSENVWHYAGALFDYADDNLHCIVDETEVIDASVTFNNSTYTLGSPSYVESISSYYTTSPNWEFPGIIDEVRISKIERSVAWRKTTSLSLHDDLFYFTEVVADTTLAICPFDWNYWNTVTINSPETTDTPLVVKVVLDNSDSSIDFDFDFAEPDGRDIRFLANNGTDYLRYWREYYQGPFVGTDNFNEAILDTHIWEEHRSSSGEIERASPKGLFFGFDTTYVGNEFNYIQSKYELHGDFDIEIEYHSLITDSANDNGIELRVGELGVETAGDDTQLRDEAFIRAGYQSGDVFESNHRIDGTWQSAQTVSRFNNLGKVRVVRSGSNLTFYYDDDDTSGWTTWRTVSFHNRDVIIRLAYNGAGGSSPSAIIDNFVVNSGSPEKTEYAIFWVELPCLVEGDNTIFMVYGNPSATDVSNSSIFTFFDDFDIGSTLDTTDKWALADFGGGGTWEQANSIVRNATRSGAGGYRSTENGVITLYSAPLRYRAYIKVVDNGSNSSILWGYGNINDTHGIWVRPSDDYELYGTSTQKIIDNDEDWHIIECQWFSGTPDDEDGIIDDNFANVKTQTAFNDNPASIELWKNTAYLNARWAFFTPMLASGDPVVTIGNWRECARLEEDIAVDIISGAFQDDVFFEFFEEDIAVDIVSGIFQDEVFIEPYEEDVAIDVISGIFQTDSKRYDEDIAVDIVSGIFQDEVFIEPFEEPVETFILSNVFEDDTLVRTEDVNIEIVSGIFQTDDLLVPFEEDIAVDVSSDIFETHVYYIGSEDIAVDVISDIFQIDTLIEPFPEDITVDVISGIFQTEVVFLPEDLVVNVVSGIFQEDEKLIPFPEDVAIDVISSIFLEDIFAQPDSGFVDVVSYIPDLVETIIEPFEDEVSLQIVSGILPSDLWVKYPEFPFAIESITHIFSDEIFTEPLEEDIEIACVIDTFSADFIVAYEEFPLLDLQMLIAPTDVLVIPLVDDVAVDVSTLLLADHIYVIAQEPVSSDVVSSILIDDLHIEPEPDEGVVYAQSEINVYDTWVRYTEEIDIDVISGIFQTDELLEPFEETLTAQAIIEPFVEDFSAVKEFIFARGFGLAYQSEVFFEALYEDVCIDINSVDDAVDFMLEYEEFLSSYDLKVFIASTDDIVLAIQEEATAMGIVGNDIPFQPHVFGEEKPLIDIPFKLFIDENFIEPYSDDLNIESISGVFSWDTWVRYKEDIIVFYESYVNAYSVNQYDHQVTAQAKGELQVHDAIPLQIDQGIAFAKTEGFLETLIEDYYDDLLVDIEGKASIKTFLPPPEYFSEWSSRTYAEDEYFEQCPDDYTFRNVEQGDIEIASVKWTNPVPVEFQVRSVIIEGRDAELFTYLGITPFTLPANGFALLMFQFSPILLEDGSTILPDDESTVYYGEKFATVRIKGTQGGVPSVEYSFELTACAITPVYDRPDIVIPDPIDLDTFTEIEAGQSTYQIPKRRKPIIIR